MCVGKCDRLATAHVIARDVAAPLIGAKNQDSSLQEITVRENPREDTYVQNDVHIRALLCSNLCLNVVNTLVSLYTHDS